MLTPFGNMKGDPARHLGIRETNRQMTNTRSEETFEFIRTAIGECSQHIACQGLLGSIQDSVSAWPSRLIKINPDDIESVCLTDITAPCPPYITLSHCWGKAGLGDKDKTTTRSLERRKTSISVGDLCPNFRDACEIVRRLGT
jgi:hypothetical protein